jgi:hypothetical protein
VGGLVPVAHVAEYPARVRDSVSAVAQQLDKIAVPPGEAIVQFERFAGTLCGARGACQSGRMNQVALPFSGGSATGLSATDAWRGPLPVMTINVSETEKVRDSKCKRDHS